MYIIIVENFNYLLKVINQLPEVELQETKLQFSQTIHKTRNTLSKPYTVNSWLRFKPHLCATTPCKSI